MIRVVHVITGLQTGGAEMMLYKVVSRMDRSRFDNRVISLMDEGTVGPRIASAGVPVVSLGMDQPLTTPAVLWRLADELRLMTPDVVLGWLPHGNLFATLSASMARLRVPVLWNVRQSLDRLSQEKLGTRAAIKAGAMLSRSPRVILYNSRVGAEQHERIGYLRRKRRLIPNGFDCDRFDIDPVKRQQARSELGIEPAEILVGNIGRYHPMKGHDTFFAAAGQLARRHPHVRFLLAGRSVTAENPVLARLVAQHGLQNRVLLLGERADMDRVTAALDVATLSSSWGEGFPNVIGEAMACGVPCVVTSVGDAGWVVGEDGGFVVPPRDPDAFAAACEQLVIGAPEARQRMGLAARERIVAHFSLDAIVAQYETLFEEHAGARAKPRVRAPVRRVSSFQRQSSRPGALVISLDFELHWGMRDTMLPDAAGQRYFLGARRALPKMLRLFEEYGVSVTWATVGLLFARNRAEAEELRPTLFPAYENQRLDPYAEPVGEGEADDPLHFAGSLIDRIAAVPGQEIATHTFSHYYCLEPGQGAEMFRQDLASAVEVARRRGHSISSIVFPRNQHNPEYDPILLEAGIRAYRGNESGWMHSPANARGENSVRRAARLLDDYLGTVRCIDWSELPQGDLVQIPASCFLRPAAPWRVQADRIRRRAIYTAMQEAAVTGRLLHLWWHPHNMSRHPALNLLMLRELLEHFAMLRETCGMQSLNMQAVTETVAGASV